MFECNSLRVTIALDSVHVAARLVATEAARRMAHRFNNWSERAGPGAHAARCVACHGVRSPALHVAPIAECSRLRRTIRVGAVAVGPINPMTDSDGEIPCAPIVLIVEREDLEMPLTPTLG